MADFFERVVFLKTIKLDSRLFAVASLVREGSRVADIGTDHGYVPVFLLQSGISPSAVASDLRKMPLENAEKTIGRYELTGQIKTRLSNGLENIEKTECDDIIIAGMGGLLIKEILEKAPWVKSDTYRLILQPMSHAEDVREYLFENGFKIVRELCCEDKRHCYCAIAAEFDGKTREHSPAEKYIGRIAENNDEASRVYLLNQLSRLKKRRDALKNSDTDASEVERLEKIILDFETAVGGKI